MPPSASKYFFSMGRSYIIPSGSTSASYVAHPNLAKIKADGSGLEYVNPDTVLNQFSSVFAFGQAVSPWVEVTRPVVPDGSVTITVRIPAALPADATIVVNSQMVYWHSIESSDHTA